MPQIEQGGRRANITGGSLEDFISNLIEQAGYEYALSDLFAPLKCMEQPIYTKQYNVGHDIFGKDRKCDFILYHPRKYPNCLVIESKWQQSRGSVEEKLPFLVLTIQKSGYDTSVVLDGGGYSPGAETWLRGQAGSACLKQVFNMVEFQKFVNDGRL